MNNQYHGFYPAKILSYSAAERTAKVSVEPVTKGIEGGITATFAYPVGDDDLDTEREILTGADCYVFFDQGDPYSPVIWAYRSHGTGATVGHRRIRQENIELYAKNNIDLFAKKVLIEAPDIILKGNVTHEGNYKHTGDMTHQGDTLQVGKYTLNGSQTISGGLGVSGTSNFAAAAYFPQGAVINGTPYSVHYHVGAHGNTSPPV
ncbi:hypothetical protein [Acinetobacter sp. CFCC 10889]|uniref:hypothetical protein n=1 Tax=Acinetobacter sp. CFCC 10889 TaxID=1775557 RepID=UPI000DD06FFE|nr:hypothetical protein [Acinetobacter sp. CFCC 10889]